MPHVAGGRSLSSCDSSFTGFQASCRPFCRFVPAEPDRGLRYGNSDSSIVNNLRFKIIAAGGYCTCCASALSPTSHRATTTTTGVPQRRGSSMPTLNQPKYLGSSNTWYRCPRTPSPRKSCGNRSPSATASSSTLLFLSASVSTSPSKNLPT